MNKKKIVFLGFFPGFGGAEKSMIMVANGLAKLGNDVTIISLKDNNVVYDIDEKVRYLFIPDKISNKLMTPMSRFFELKKVLMNIKPDVVISFWLQPAIFAAILSKFIGFKTIYSERGDPTDSEYRGILKILRRVFLRITDGFVFQTNGAKSCFSENIQKKSVVINNPVYIKYEEYEISKKRKKSIVNVGRLHKQKNQELLIEAFCMVKDKFQQYKLEIYGDGELEEFLLNKVKSMNMEGRVELKGTTKQILDEIKDASLFILSSDYEGMPNALMEAMALGIPCISTDCSPGGARELINNGENGLLCKRNDVEEMAYCIERILKDYNLANKLAYNAKDICNTHSTENIFRKWNDFIEGMMR